MRTPSAMAAVLWLLLETANPAGAHHSASAEFDVTKKLKVTGALSKLDWVNPHTIFYIEVTENGSKASWSWELPSPNQLMRAGWRRDSMKLGDVITVEGIHARDGSNHGMAMAVTMTATGRQLFAGKAEEP